jgi:MscS family membrane protein
MTQRRLRRAASSPNDTEAAVRSGSDVLRWSRRRRPVLGRPSQYALVLALALTVLGVRAAAQLDLDPAPTVAAPAEQEVAEDSLDRHTPRGTVFGFLAAARDDNFELAAEYLDTRARGPNAARLAQQLYVVMDARLQSRLTMISERPDGSRANPLKANQEVVGTIESRQKLVEVVVERTRRGTPPVWLFSRATLTAVPDLYDEVIASRSMLPPWFTRTRVVGAPIVEWLAVLLLIPGLYLAISLLNRVLTRLIAFGRRRQPYIGKPRLAIPMPVRLFLVALIGRWLLWSLSFSLYVRQFWSLLASLVVIAAIVWLLMIISRSIETVPRADTTAGIGLLRLIRRGADVIIVFAGIVAVLLRFGIDPTPAIAGLGVGGIAIALAAQKTLENVIAGASLIFDKAVNVGDFLKMNEVTGTVDRIGLRSTRIRTLDRTIVSVPNSVIAGASVETFSARDMFWFHPMIGLSYETTPEQLRLVLEGLRRLLREHKFVDPSAVRVRFFRLGTSSLDLDVSAYLSVSGWDQFLEVQEDLLLSTTELVERVGTRIALPSQTTYVRTQASDRGQVVN